MDTTQLLLTGVAGLLATLLGLAVYGLRRVDALYTRVDRMHAVLYGESGANGLLGEIKELRRWRHQMGNQVTEHESRLMDHDGALKDLQRPGRGRGD